MAAPMKPEDQQDQQNVASPQGRSNEGKGWMGYGNVQLSWAADFFKSVATGLKRTHREDADEQIHDTDERSKFRTTGEGAVPVGQSRLPPPSLPSITTSEDSSNSSISGSPQSHDIDGDSGDLSDKDDLDEDADEEMELPSEDAEEDASEPMMIVGIPMKALLKSSGRKEFRKALNQGENLGYYIRDRSDLDALSNNKNRVLRAINLMTTVNEFEHDRCHSDSSTDLDTNLDTLKKSRFVKILSTFPKFKISQSNGNYVSCEKGNMEAKFRYIHVGLIQGEWGWANECFSWHGKGPVDHSEAMRDGFVRIMTVEQWRAERGDDVPINVVVVEGRDVPENCYLGLHRIRFNLMTPMKPYQGRIKPESLEVLETLVKVYEDSTRKSDIKINMSKEYGEGLQGFMHDEKESSSEFRKQLKPWYESKAFPGPAAFSETGTDGALVHLNMSPTKPSEGATNSVATTPSTSPNLSASSQSNQAPTQKKGKKKCRRGGKKHGKKTEEGIATMIGRVQMIEEETVKEEASPGDLDDGYEEISDF